MTCPASLLSPPEAMNLGTPALAKEDHAEILSLQSEGFDRKRYNAAASVQDNIVFGRIACGEVGATARVAEVLREVTDGLPLRQISIDLGLDYSTGGALIRGAVARAVLKRRGLRSRRAGRGESQPGVEAETLPGQRSFLLIHRATSPEFERPFGSLMMSLPAAPE